MVSSSVVPGQVLASTSSHIPGPGTHVYENNILASILGQSVITPAPNKSSKPTISVPHQATTIASLNSIPKVGSAVLCRVTRVRQRELSASILAIINIDPTSPSSAAAAAAAIPAHDIISYSQITDDDLQFQCILRREDIRTHEKDKIVINDMYRVGDIVRATVISLGDERNYYVSTAGNEFGVVVATSEAGNAMVPASWKEMKDAVTGKGESRKVAKPS